MNRQAAARHYVFDPSQLEPFEIGAHATVILCWPSPDDQSVRDEMQVKIAAQLLRDTVGDDEEALNTPRLMKPKYAFRDVERDAEHRTRLDVRLASALHVGNLAMPFLKHAYDGSDVRFPGMKDLSIASLIHATEETSGDWVDPANFRKRTWLPWLPVVHLAAAARIVRQRVEISFGRKPTWPEMMTDATLLGSWLGEARIIAPVVAQAFPKEASRLIHIGLVGVNLPATT